jgi:hypothetical protein
MTRTDWNALDPDHWLVAWTRSETELKDVLDQIDAVPEGTAARLLRAERMRDKKGLHKECASGLQFPQYYGRVWDALSDCLEDLDWLDERGLVVGISNASQLLGAASDADLEMFGHILIRAKENWRHPVYERDLREDPQPFTVVLQDSESGLRSLASRASSFQGLLEQLP